MVSSTKYVVGTVVVVVLAVSIGLIVSSLKRLENEEGLFLIFVIDYFHLKIYCLLYNVYACHFDIFIHVFLYILFI